MFGNNFEDQNIYTNVLLKTSSSYMLNWGLMLSVTVFYRQRAIIAGRVQLINTERGGEIYR